MNGVVARIKWIMLVSGALTCTMIFAAIAPQAALRATFGATLESPLAEIVVRNWSALIALVGAMLVYGAFNPPTRPLVVTVASLSKLTFISLVLIYGPQYLGHQAKLDRQEGERGALLGLLVFLSAVIAGAIGFGLSSFP